MIDQPTIDRITDAAQIQDVVGDYVTLRKRGVNLLGLCPFHNEKTPPWVIKSETGILSGDGKDLLLNGKVAIDRAKGEGVSQLTINTSVLKVKPETSYAETNEWAELISPPNKTTGTGMKLIYAQPIHLQLLANVKGKYETK